jgi:ABC-2 type transport system permease protein
MNKIWLIIKREYLAKVRKKTFILSTILFPVLYFALIFGTGYISDRANKKLKIAVVDSSGFFSKEKIDAANRTDSSNILSYTSIRPDVLQQNFSDSGFDGFIVVPADTNWQKGFKDLVMLSNRTLGVESSNAVERKLNGIWKNVKNEKLGIDADDIKKLEESQVSVIPVNLKDKKSNSGLSTLIGVIAAFLIYIMLLLYGSQVMMGVTEEKTNRIAEVMISSVKPFQLMLGKIIGIGLVAFTQVLIWLTCVFIIYNVTGKAGGGQVEGMLGKIQEVFTSVNMGQVMFFLVFYLMGGFFFYSSLFAAAGSAVNEDMREAQSLSFPLMMPIIFSMAMIGAVIKDPSGPLAVWGSIIPFTSPIIMMIRIPFGVPGTVPWWQVGLSMAALIGGFIITTWFAAKIYRTGILMYGKKASWKEMMKWAFRKN